MPLASFAVLGNTSTYTSDTRRPTHLLELCCAALFTRCLFAERVPGRFVVNHNAALINVPSAGTVTINTVVLIRRPRIVAGLGLGDRVQLEAGAEKRTGPVPGIGPGEQRTVGEQPAVAGHQSPVVEQVYMALG